MTDAPTLARDQWEAHPHYPAHVLLLGSHDNFRRLNRFLIQQVESPDAHLRPLHHLYVRWISAMRSHEAYEERKLYPYLVRRWGVSFDAAEAGHDALHAAYDQVVSAFDAAHRSGDERPMVITALERHEVILSEHLELEEDLVIPRLLALEPPEFADFVRSRA